jgi:hypothetical protein
MNLDVLQDPLCVLLSGQLIIGTPFFLISVIRSEGQVI